MNEYSIFQYRLYSIHTLQCCEIKHTVMYSNIIYLHKSMLCTIHTY